MGSAVARFVLPLVLVLLLAQGLQGAAAVRLVPTAVSPTGPSPVVGVVPSAPTSVRTAAVAASLAGAAAAAAPSADLGTGFLGPSVAPLVRPAASVPTSDVFETPPPTIPAATPTTFVVASNDVCTRSSGCDPSLNVTAPAGPYSLILLNYTGQAINGVYDSSFHATVDSVPVLFGTTPELSTWTVLKNVTEYSALFNHTVNVRFVLGFAATNGYFKINVSIAFYPVAKGTVGPSVPNDIVPILPFSGLNGGRPVVTANATVPTDVQNATLEIYSYGFGPNDEFWYSNNPPYRAVNLTVDGNPLAVVQPFEYVNTGGLDLYLWDPVTGAYTGNNPPYQIDVTSALGALEGTHEYNASMIGALYPSNSWIVGATLLLYTNSSYFGAQLTHFSAPLPVEQRGSGSSGATEQVTRSIDYASTLTSLAGTESSASWRNETFSGVVAATGATVSARTTEVVHTVGPHGTEWINTTSAPSIAFAVNVTASPLTTCNGNSCQNETYRMVSFFQNWNRSRIDTTIPLAGPRTVVSTYTNDNVSANGAYSAQVEYLSGGGAVILQLYYYWSNTTKTYHSLTAIGTLALYYNHTLVSQLRPTDLSGQGTITKNVVQFTDAATLQASRPSTEVGIGATLTAAALGFGGPFSFRWGGLPPGCVSSSGPTAVCTPTASGTFSITVHALSASGQLSAPATLIWTVQPELTAWVNASSTTVDLGYSTTLTLATQGGEGPMSCTWFENGAIYPGGSCAPSVAILLDTLGAWNVTVHVVDALAVATNTSIDLTVVSLPGVVVTISPSPGTSVPVKVALGTALTLSAQVDGGTAPYSYAWSQNGVKIPTSGNQQNYSFSGSVIGNYTFVVRVTDSEGAISSSPAIQIDVSNPSTSSNGGNGSPGGHSTTPTGSTSGEIVIGIGLVAAVALLAMVLLLRRRTPPSAGQGPPTI